jgi:hypothetical protein
MDTGDAMKAYIIIYHKHYTMLPDLVNELITQGYQPVGGPFIGPNNELGQALVLTPKSKSKEIK